MSDAPGKPYRLEERTLIFAKEVIHLCRKIPRDTINNSLISQLIRSSGSVGANYREANESPTRRDFTHKMGLTRKECKEASYWLELSLESNPSLKDLISPLLKESIELRKIFSAIIDKTRTK